MALTDPSDRVGDLYSGVERRRDEMRGQDYCNVPAKPDPVRTLENTRRTLLKLVENIDAALAASKEQAQSR